MDFVSINPDEIVGVFGDNRNEENVRGRRNNEVAELRRMGEQLRNLIRDRFKSEGLRRPNRSLSRRNEVNHTVMLNNST